MKLCVPSPGSLLRLSKDWTFNVTDNTNYRCVSLVHIKSALREEIKVNDRFGNPKNYFKISNQQITLPAGTLLRLNAFQMTPQKPPRYNRTRTPDRINFKLIETSIELEPNKIFTTSYGRRKGARKSKRPSSLQFQVEASDFNNLEFEFDV